MLWSLPAAPPPWASFRKDGACHRDSVASCASCGTAQDQHQRRRPFRRSCFPKTTSFPVGCGYGTDLGGAHSYDRRTTSIASEELLPCTTPFGWPRCPG